MTNEITWQDFEKVELRVGTITDVKDFPEARNPAYQVWVDLGEEIGVKKASAQITKLYSKEDLVGKQVICVVNFPEKQVAHFMSQCLVTGVVVSKEEVVLICPDRKVENGLRVG